MKALNAVAITVLILCSAWSTPRADEPAAKEPDELACLQQSYDQKRSDAIKPVFAWYENQLETLQKKLTQKRDLDGAVVVRNELEVAKQRSAFVVPAKGTNKEPEEFVRLRKSYQQKRIDALKPVMTGYQSQLETLEKKLTQKNELDRALLVRNELEALRQSLAVELGSELLRALLATTWSWTDKPKEKGVEMTFDGNGTVSHIGMQGTWQITGPREVTIKELTGAKSKFVLRFDPKFTSYEQFGGPIHGRRWQ